MKRIVYVLFLILGTATQLRAQPTQTIKGIVVDQASNQPIALATVVMMPSESLSAATTDSTGHFLLSRIAVGRYNFEVSCAGYETMTIREVMVSSGKETILTISLKQSITHLKEVAVQAGVNREQAVNSAATLSSRMLNIETTRRYAGGFDDPARLVAAFAGVSGNVGNNAIIVRGNNPQALQWKMEGIEIPAPNHLGDMRVFGGGGLTALSTLVLGNSDFLSGAMPANYNNALSGVLDLSMRNGNNQQREHTFQLGVVGIDAATEGPFKKGGKSSYLINYRYSTLALVSPLLAENADGIKYQDLSFKLNFPTKKAGTFSVWGLGLQDRLTAKAKQDVDLWVYDDDRENHDVKIAMGATGIGHQIAFGNRQYLKTSVAATFSGIDYPVSRLDSNLYPAPKSKLSNGFYNLTLSSFLNTKFNVKHNNRTGLTVTSMNYNIQLQQAIPAGAALHYISNESGQSTLFSAFTNSSLQLNKNTLLTTGLNAQFFTLTNKASIEPRIGIRYKLAPKHALALAYGLHSRLERLNYYFIKNNAGEYANQHLDFTKAHHLIIGYDVNVTSNTHLKIEAYYQQLFNIPVIADSSFSLINQQNDWFFNAPLQSTGIGSNYGIDLTFEQYLSEGYYYLATASLFNARYRGGDGMWRNNRYNRNYTINLLAGKEWLSGKRRQNVLGLNARICYQGGDRYSPVDLGSSQSVQSVHFDERKAFSLQYPAAFTAHFTASYRMNRKKTSHELALKILNLTQYKEYVGFRYNYQTANVDFNREPVVIPNLSYKIDF